MKNESFSYSSTEHYLITSTREAGLKARANRKLLPWKEKVELERCPQRLHLCDSMIQGTSNASLGKYFILIYFNN